MFAWRSEFLRSVTLSINIGIVNAATIPIMPRVINTSANVNAANFPLPSGEDTDADNL